MKRISLVVLCNLFAVCFSLSCQQFHHHNISIHVSDSDHYYKMYARYNPNATRDLEDYMTNKIGKRSNMSFANTRIKGQLSLTDNTSFYMEKYPGYIEIKLDKEKNSYESYRRIKQMCEGIKKVIAQ